MINQNKGGVKANSISLDRHSNRLVLVRYKDHVEFRNSSHKLYFNAVTRETVGWLILETDDCTMLLFDRSTEPLPFEATESGLVIRKPDIVEIVELREIK